MGYDLGIGKATPFVSMMGITYRNRAKLDLAARLPQNSTMDRGPIWDRAGCPTDFGGQHVVSLQWRI